MASVTLLHLDETFTIPALQAMTKFGLYQKNPALLISPYRVQSPVSLPTFREFLSALEGNVTTITSTNFTELKQLCEEFGFSEIAGKLLEFRLSIDREDSESVGRIASLEERANQHSHDFAVLQNEVRQLSADFARLVVEVSALRSASAGIRLLSDEVSALQSRASRSPNDAVSQQHSAEIGEMRNAISDLQIRVDAFPGVFDSRIVLGFPEIFAQFRGQRFSLLWRGSRDGFRAYEFHRRCDGHANTLTVILDTKGNVFGGFTPLEWESRTKSPYRKVDDSMKSFLFTLKNPNNIMPRKFTLRIRDKREAIYCEGKRGPCFDDIRVCDNANTCNDSTTAIGAAYVNDTGFDDRIVLAGARNFQVKEIEVFEIIE